MHFSPSRASQGLRFLLGIACVASTTAASCKDFRFDCEGCLAHRFGVLQQRKRCNFCISSPEGWTAKAGGKVLYDTVCTSKPHQKCARDKGWHVITPEAGRARQVRNKDKCDKYMDVLQEQATVMSAVGREASNEQLRSKAGSHKGMHYKPEQDRKFGVSLLYTEKVGTAVRIPDDDGDIIIKRMHLTKDTRSYWVDELYGDYRSALEGGWDKETASYAAHLKKFKRSDYKILSRAAFLGKAYKVCKKYAEDALGHAAADPRKGMARIKFKKKVEPELNAAFRGDTAKLRDWKLIDEGTLSVKDCLNLGAGGVAYLNAREREEYEYVLNGDGRLVKKKGGEKLDTCGMRTEERGGGWAIFVAQRGTIGGGAKGIRMYSNSHTPGRFHHSSFLAGDPVMAAGEWLVKNGKILAIDDKTGHYKIGAAHLAQFILAGLMGKRAGRGDHMAIGIEDATVAHLKPGRPSSYYAMPAMELFRNADLFRQVGNPTSTVELRDAVANEWNELFWGNPTAAIRLTNKELSDLRKFSCAQFSGGAATTDDTAKLRLHSEHPLFKLLQNRNYRNRDGRGPNAVTDMVPQTDDLYYNPQSLDRLQMPHTRRGARDRRRRAQNAAGPQDSTTALVPASDGDETR